MTLWGPLTPWFLLHDRLQKVLRRHVDLAVELDRGELDEPALAGRQLDGLIGDLILGEGGKRNDILLD